MMLKPQVMRELVKVFSPDQVIAFLNRFNDDRVWQNSVQAADELTIWLRTEFSHAVKTHELMDKIKTLRHETGLGVIRCKKALEAFDGDLALARAHLAADVSVRPRDRPTGHGVVECYVHHDKTIGAMVLVTCETDFVARSDLFKFFAKMVCRQVAAANPVDEEALLNQPLVDSETSALGAATTVAQLIQKASVQFGENVRVAEFSRFTTPARSLGTTMFQAEQGLKS